MGKPSYKTTFFIFPAMLPLIEILPWLLGLVGGAAGIFEFMREAVFNKPKTRAVFLFSLFCIMAGAGLYIYHRATLPPAASGTSAVKITEQSKLEIFKGDKSIIKMPDTFGLIWRKTSLSNYLGTPGVTERSILIGTYDKKIISLNKNNGAIQWIIHKKEPVFTSPYISNNYAVMGEGLHTAPQSTLTAFNADNGAILWERRFLSHLEAGVIEDKDNHTIIVPNGASGLWALNAETGEIVWHNPIGHIDITPALLNGVIYAPAKIDEDKDGSAFTMVDAKTGKTLKREIINGNPMGEVLIDGDTLVFNASIGQVGLNKATDKGWLYAFNSRGSRLWSKEFSAMILPEGHILPQNHMAFFALKDSALLAVDTLSGNTAWSKKLGGEIKADASLFSHNHTPLITAATADGHIEILNALNGKHLKSIKIDTTGYSPAIYSDDVLYFFEPYAVNAFGPVSALLKEQK